MKPSILKFVFCSLILIGALTGCAGPTWQHSGISDKSMASKQLVKDSNRCTLVSYDAAPMPVIVQAPTPQNTNVTVRGSTYNSATGERTHSTYTGQASTGPSGFAGGFASGMSSGMALGAAINAQRREEAIFNACMQALGWSDVPADSKLADQKPAEPKNAESKKIKPTSLRNLFTNDDVKIYIDPKEEWAGDTSEFLWLYPQYGRGQLYEKLNERVIALAKSRVDLTGTQILVAARKAMIDAGESTNEQSIGEERKLALLSYADAVASKSMDQSAMASLYIGLIKSHPGSFMEKRAAYWAQKSSVSGFPLGRMIYGFITFHGIGVGANKIKGYALVKDASRSLDAAKETLINFEREMTTSELVAAKE